MKSSTESKQTGKSLRKLAEELGISPAYLSYMVNGKRPWREDLYQRYCYLVNTSVNSGSTGGPTAAPRRASTGTNIGMVGDTGLEPVTSAMSTQCSNQLS